MYMELYFVITILIITLIFTGLLILYNGINKLDLAMLFVLILVMIFMFYGYSSPDVIYVKSDIDNNDYLVRDLPDKNIACNMLAQIRQNMLKINDYLKVNKEKYKEHADYINNLNNKIENSIIMESGENAVYTSYSVNKGEQIVFCLRSRSDSTGTLHDMNLLMYVVLHEMSHVACPEYGHTDLFKQIFNFITQRAMEIDLYNKIPFNQTPTEYCGLMITESIV